MVSMTSSRILMTSWVFIYSNFNSHSLYLLWVWLLASNAVPFSPEPCFLLSLMVDFKLWLMLYLSPRPGFPLSPVDDIKLFITWAWLPAFTQGWCCDFTQAWLPTFACGYSPEPGFPLSLEVDVVVSPRPGFLLLPVDNEVFYSPEPGFMLSLEDVAPGVKIFDVRISQVWTAVPYTQS